MVAVVVPAVTTTFEIAGGVVSVVDFVKYTIFKRGGLPLVCSLDLNPKPTGALFVPGAPTGRTTMDRFAEPTQASTIAVDRGIVTDPSGADWIVASRTPKSEPAPIAP